MEKQVGTKERQAKAVAMRLQPGSDFSYEQLYAAAMTVAHRNDPLRDSIVLREAKGRADLLSPEATKAWSEALDRLRSSMPNWLLESMSVAGGKGDTIVLAASDRVRTWIEKRYSTLVREALADTPYTDVQFVSDYELGEGETCR